MKDTNNHRPTITSVRIKQHNIIAIIIVRQRFWNKHQEEMPNGRHGMKFEQKSKVLTFRWYLGQVRFDVSNNDPL